MSVEAEEGRGAGFEKKDCLINSASSSSSSCVRVAIVLSTAAARAVFVIFVVVVVRRPFSAAGGDGVEPLPPAARLPPARLLPNVGTASASSFSISSTSSLILSLFDSHVFDLAVKPKCCGKYDSDSDAGGGGGGDRDHRKVLLLGACASPFLRLD